MKIKKTPESALENAKNDLDVLEDAMNEGSKLTLIKSTLRTGVKAGGGSNFTKKGCEQPLYGNPNSAD